MAAEPEHPRVRIETDADNLARMKDVVAKHLDRFAFREAPLTFDWTDLGLDAAREDAASTRRLHLKS
jgi:hypothetical protein